MALDPATIGDNLFNSGLTTLSYAPETLHVDQLLNSNDGVSFKSTDDDYDEDYEDYDEDDYEAINGAYPSIPLTQLTKQSIALPHANGKSDPIFQSQFNKEELVMPELAQYMWRYLQQLSPVSSQIQIYDNWITNNLISMLQSRHFTVGNISVYLEDITYEKPIHTINGKVCKLYPKYCEQKGLTYRARFYANLNYVDNKNTYEKQRVALFEIPVMKNSVLCNLRDLNPEQLLLVGESPKEPGGYFIIRGLARVVLGQEQLAVNRIFLLQEKAYGSTCRITTNSLRGTSLFRLILQKGSNQLILAQPSSVVNKIRQADKTKKDNELGINVLHLFQFLGYDLAGMIRLLTLFIHPDQLTIIEGKLSENILDLNLHPNATVRVMDLIGNVNKNLTPNEQAAEVNFIIMNDIFPHLNNIPCVNGQESINDKLTRIYGYKAYLLALMLARYLQKLANLRLEDDRNSIKNKRFEWAGRIMEQFTRTAWRKIFVDVQKKVSEGSLVVNHNNLQNLPKALDKESNNITTSFESSFTDSKWGPKGSKTKSNVATILDNTTLMSIMGHLLTINVPIFRKDTSAEKRSVVNSQYCKICPASTPEGNNCGLLKQLALLTRSTPESDDMPYLSYIVSSPLVQMYPNEQFTTQVIIYGKFMGWAQGEHLYYELVNLRKEGYFSYYSSIVWDKQIDNCIYVDCGPSILVHPVLPLNNNVPILLSMVNGRKLAEASITEWFLYGGIQFMSTWEQEQEHIKIADRYEDVLALQERKLALQEKLLIAEQQLQQVLKGESITVEQYTSIVLTPQLAQSRLAKAQQRVQRVKQGEKIIIRDAVAVLTVEEAEQLLAEAQQDLIDVNSNNIVKREMLGSIILTEELAKQRIETARLQLDKIMQYKDYTHCQFDGQAVMGLLATLITASDRDYAPRVTYQINMGKQAPGVNDNYFNAMDNKIKRLLYPQPPIAQTEAFRYLALNYRTPSQNIIISWMPADGNEEDGTRINLSLLASGKLRLAKTLIYTAKISAGEKLGRPALKEHDRKERYQQINDQGVPYIGAYLSQRQCVIGKVGNINASNAGQIQETNESVYINFTEEGVVQWVKCLPDDNASTVVIVSLNMSPFPQLGDKGAGLHAQKGVINRIVHNSQMPYTLKQGISPDLMINPSALPSRKTIGFLKEQYYNKAAILNGQILNLSAFRNYVNNAAYANHGFKASLQNQEDRDSLTRETLKAYGYDEMGNEVMVSPVTGKILDVPIFMGPVAYQSLKHRTIDKNQFRGTGRRDTQTRQPNQGRADNGGLRIGEMERNAIEGFGASSLLRYFLCEASDCYTTVFCKECGIFAEFNPCMRSYQCRLCNAKKQDLDRRALLEGNNQQLIAHINREIAQLNEQYTISYNSLRAQHERGIDVTQEYNILVSNYNSMLESKKQQIKQAVEHISTNNSVKSTFGRVTIPYVFKLFIHMMGSLGLFIRLNLSDYQDIYNSLNNPERIITEYDSKAITQMNAMLDSNRKHEYAEYE